MAKTVYRSFGLGFIVGWIIAAAAWVSLGGLMR